MRSLFFTFFLLGSAEVLAQADVRVYYNKFEWVGVAGGYTVDRWRFEASGSWHQQELIGPHETGHPDSVINGYIAYPVFEDDVWIEKTATVTGRILRLMEQTRPWFGLYYGIYLRYATQDSELTEAHWSFMEADMASKYNVITSVQSWKIGAGLVFGAHGSIAGGVFWDTNLSLLPLIYGKERFYGTNGFDQTKLWSGFTYLSENTQHFFQVGLGYKFGPKKE